MDKLLLFGGKFIRVAQKMKIMWEYNRRKKKKKLPQLEYFPRGEECPGDIFSASVGVSDDL